MLKKDIFQVNVDGLTCAYVSCEVIFFVLFVFIVRRCSEKLWKRQKNTIIYIITKNNRKKVVSNDTTITITITSTCLCTHTNNINIHYSGWFYFLVSMVRSQKTAQDCARLFRASIMKNNVQMHHHWKSRRRRKWIIFVWKYY